MNTFEKLKHGTLDAQKNLVFWAYDSDNRERWVTPEKFAESREKAMAYLNKHKDETISTVGNMSTQAV